MEEFIVRPAQLEDVPTLRRFEQGVIETERPFDPTLKEGKINYYDIEGLISSPLAELVVAETGNELAGSGYIKILEAEAYLAHKLYGYIGFMYVSPAHRGKGVADKILAALRQWAISQGITELRLEVYKDNEPAIRAYEKAGFVQHMIIMRKSASEAK